jgi:hypothetical protein
MHNYRGDMTHSSHQLAATSYHHHSTWLLNNFLHGFRPVAEPGIELSRVEQISYKNFWGKKSHVINKKWSKQIHLSHFIEYKYKLTKNKNRYNSAIF